MLMSVIGSIFNFLRFNKRNWKAVALCVFAATVFWFFNALNKSYTANISFPLAFDYPQEGYIPVRPLPDELRMNVKGIGWNLFRRSIGIKVPPLIIPIERPTEVKKIVGSTLPVLFANQLEGFEINLVLTDTLYIAIEPRKTRWVSLALDSPSLLFKNGYGIASNVTIQPDSIFIEGPFNLITTLSEPHYMKVDERNIDENFNDEVEVEFLNKELVRRNPPLVRVKFDVDRLISQEDSVPLELRNLPSNVHPMIESAKVQIRLAIPERYASQYHKDSIHVVIDFKKIKRGKSWFLPEIIGLPPYTRIVRNDSVRLKF
jgi:hypothetical protein